MELTWPERPMCHGEKPKHHEQVSVFWREPQAVPHRYWGEDMPPLPLGVHAGPYGESFRTCSYCGSIHPHDLYEFLVNPPMQPRVCHRCDTESKDEPDILQNYDEWQRWTMRRSMPHTCRVTLSGSDWKYGWPHKFYVLGIPNTIAGEMCVSGSESGPEKNDKGEFVYENGRLKRYHRWVPATPAPPYVQAKFYNQHLLDLDVHTFDVLAKVIEENAAIKFELRFVQDDRALYYVAPYPGYQA